MRVEADLTLTKKIYPTFKRSQLTLKYLDFNTCVKSFCGLIRKKNLIATSLISLQQKKRKEKDERYLLWCVFWQIVN